MIGPDHSPFSGFILLGEAIWDFVSGAALHRKIDDLNKRLEDAQKGHSIGTCNDKGSGVLDQRKA